MMKIENLKMKIFINVLMDFQKVVPQGAANLRSSKISHPDIKTRSEDLYGIASAQNYNDPRRY